MDSVARYSTISIVLHWLIALNIGGLLVMGIVMTSLGDEQISLKFELYQWHKSFGILVLFLTIVRLVWRFVSAAPTPSGTGKLKTVAKYGHWLLYALTFLIPLAGWAMVSASPWNIPTVLFDVIAWPHLPWLSALEDKASAEASFKLMHKTLAYGAIVVISGHVAAALWHQFILKDNLFSRMWFARERNPK